MRQASSSVRLVLRELQQMQGPSPVKLSTLLNWTFASHTPQNAYNRPGSGSLGLGYSGSPYKLHGEAQGRL